ncbi:carboxypeptidase-like regulatory domain-containing protein [Chitinophaga sp. CB10]|uniref:carboxypeptidase-like regulatory domain-containing protein n=1 Tax=Chitinophaga sp. CB10 TaxID=1891659 RepID=UPI0025BB80A6|nr:carboxypeptidase-like regulatory domain-containing protein [Chitinophaga sp. CB10]
MKSIYILLIGCLLAVSCEYEPVGDLAGTSYIRGRLMLVDNITQSANYQPLGKKRVLLNYPDRDSLNYLFSTVTDDNGYFIFEHLKEFQPYKVYYEDTIKGVLYSARGEARPPMDTLLLVAEVARTKQRGIHITVVGSDGGTVANVPICIFNSATLSYKNNTCDGSNYSITTDATGKAFKFDIPAGTYYILAKVKMGEQQIVVKQDNVVVTDSIEFRTLTAAGPGATNGIKFVTRDATGAIIPGANICIFTSPYLFQRSLCDGSNYQLMSDAAGNASISAIPPATYYVKASWVTKDTLAAHKDTLVGTATIDLQSSVLTQVMTLQHP